MTTGYAVDSTARNTCNHLRLLESTYQDTTVKLVLACMKSFVLVTEIQPSQGEHVKEMSGRRIGSTYELLQRPHRPQGSLDSVLIPTWSPCQRNIIWWS